MFKLPLSETVKILSEASRLISEKKSIETDGSEQNADPDQTVSSGAV